MCSWRGRSADSGHGTRAAAVVLSQTNSILPATRTILRFLRLSVGLFQFKFSELPSRTHRPVHMSMWICFCSCTECSWSASFATRALRQRQSAGSTATGGFEMTAPRIFSTDSGLSVPSYVAWACARRRAATVTLMPLESQLLARRSERRLARPCRFCRALCPSLALGHAPRQLELQAPQQLAEPRMGYLRLLIGRPIDTGGQSPSCPSQSQLPSLLHAVSFHIRRAAAWQSVRLSIQDKVNMALDPAGSPGHCISGKRRLRLHERRELSQ